MNSISIIIVTYNSENEIRECLDSIISQATDIQYQVIVADNNSTDKTISIINAFDNENILLIRNDVNLGFTIANNQCLKHATGNYILFLNPDTISLINSFNELINELKNNKQLGAVAPQLRYHDGRIQKSCRRFPRRRDIIYELTGLSRILKNSKEFNHWKMTDFNHKTDSLVDQPAGAAILTRKSIIDEIGLFDEQFPMFFSDVDFCRRIIDNGNSIKFSANTYIIHKGGSSIFRNRTKMIISSHVSFWKYFNKYKVGSIGLLLNILTGIVLLILIPIRILINSLFPKIIQTKRQSL